MMFRLYIYGRDMGYLDQIADGYSDTHPPLPPRPAPLMGPPQ